ncbi:MAG: elongation factor Ts [bacterium]|nr:elongation factor Ts [bacterium]
MEITTDQIKALRDKTGVSVMQCRKALTEAGGDSEKALVLLKKRGAEAAAKKSGRTLGAGAVASYIHPGATVGALVLLSSETDFVSRNPEFQALARDIAMHVAAMKPEFRSVADVPADARAKATEVFAKEVEGKPAAMREKILEGKLNAYFGERALLEQPFVKNQDETIRALIERAVQKFGERIEVADFTRFAA